MGSTVQKGTGVALALAFVGLLLGVGVLLAVAESAEARVAVPSRFGNVETSGNDQFYYRWGTSTAVKAGSFAQNIAYSVTVTVDTDSTRLNGECGGTANDGCNWTVGATPRFLVSGVCGLDNAALNNCDGTFDRVRIFLVWDGAGVLGNPYASSTNHPIDETSPWVYAYATLTNVVPTTGTVYDAGVLCNPASANYGVGGNVCRAVWTAGSGTGANGAPSLGGLNFTGTFRVVVEATYTNANAGLAGETGTFNSDECWYETNTYRCGAASPFNVREVGFIQVTPAVNVLEPREASCATRDHFAMRGDDVCVKLEYNASAWQRSGDWRNITRSPTPAGTAVRDVECFSENECFVLWYDTSDLYLKVAKATVGDNNVLSYGATHALVEAIPQSAAAVAPTAARIVYYASGANANKLVLLYTQEDTGSNADGTSFYKSLWSYDAGSDAFTNVHANRRIYDGTSNTVTFRTITTAKGGPADAYLLACTGGDAFITSNTPQVACIAWETLGTDPAAGATTGGFNTTDLNAGASGQASKSPYVCGATGSDAFAVAYSMWDGLTGTAVVDARLLRLVRSAGGTWSAETGTQASVNDVTIVGTWATHCYHDATNVYWFINHPNDPLARATPQTAIQAFAAASAFSGQTSLHTSVFPAIGVMASEPMTAAINGSFYVLAGTQTSGDVVGRIYEADKLRPMSENMSVDVPNRAATSQSSAVGGARLAGARNNTFVMPTSQSDVAVVVVGDAEALNVTIMQGGTALASKVEELNTASKNWTFRVPASASLNAYQVKVEPFGYGAASRLPWFSQGCTVSCAFPPSREYVVGGVTDPDGGTYADGGLFLEEEVNVASCTAGTSRPVYNRGEAWGATCVAYDEWNTTTNNGGSALMKSKTFNVTSLFASEGAFASGASNVLTTDANGVFTCASCFSVPTATSGAGMADDTYAGSNDADEGSPSRANALRVAYPSTSTFASSGSWGESPAFYDYDDDYYLDASTVAWSTVMRADEQRVRATLTNARDVAVPSGATVTVEILNPSSGVETSGTRTTYAGNGTTVPFDWTADASEVAGAWTTRYGMANTASGALGNTLATTSGTGFTLSTTIGSSNLAVDVTGSTTTDYFNRGEGTTTSITLLHADGGAYRRLIGDGTVATRTVALEEYASSVSEAGRMSLSATANSGTGAWTATATVPTTATDTYASSTANQAEAKDWDLHFYDSGESASGSTGNRLTLTDRFDVDANYYKPSDTRAWSTVMRFDAQRVGATVVGVRGQNVPDATWVTVEVVDPTGATVSTGGRQTTSGVTASYDYTFSAGAERGTWKARFTVTANASSNENGMAAADGTAWTLSSVLGTASLDVDVAGQSTTKYFNRGETVRFAGTLTHADGGAYRRLNADGTTSALSVNVYSYADTRGATGAFTSPSAAVSSSTGAIAAASTDVAVPTNAPDSYASSTANQAEAVSWDVLVYEGTTPGTSTNFDGNYVNVTDFFDVDANYYYSASAKSPSGTMMRGDTVGATATLQGVRAQAVPNGVTVMTRWYDGAAASWASSTSTTSSGTTARVDSSIPNTAALGTAYFTFQVQAGASGASENTLAETGAQATYTLSSTIALTSLATQPGGTTDAFKAYNRGETVDLSGCLSHADGGHYRVKTPTGDSARTVTVQVYLNNYGATNHHAEGTTTVGPTACTFARSLTLPTTAEDTFNRTASRTVDADGYNWDVRVYDGGSTTSNANGNDAAQTNVFDADDDYYLSSNTRAWSTVMRDDEQRVTATIIGARDQLVPNGVWALVEYVDPTGAVVDTAHRQMSGGTSLPADYTFPTAAERGTWKARFTVTANATNNQNGMAATDGTTWTLSSLIAIASQDIDVAGQSTTRNFNRGEVVRFAGTLTHADGGAYRKLKADGTTTARTIGLHYYSATRGEAGSFTATGVPVASGTGVLTSTSTDATVPTTAMDTYTSAAHSTPDAGLGWSVLVYDNTMPTTPTNVNGNYVNVTAFFEVDANYYYSASAKSPSGTMMRGDTVGATATLLGVRGQNVPDGVTVTTRFYDHAGALQASETSTTTSGTTARVDAAVGNAWAVGASATIRFLVPAGAVGASENTLAETTGQTYALSSTIALSSQNTNTAGATDAFKVYNRGESVDVSGCLSHADGGHYRVKAPTGDSARTVTVQLYLNNYGGAGYVEGTTTVGPSACTFSRTLSVPTTASDTFNRTAVRTVDADGYNWDVRVYDGGTSSSSANGNLALAGNQFDVDANYYLSTDAVQWATVMRDDEQRATSTWVDAQDVAVPDGTSVWTRWLPENLLGWWKFDEGSGSTAYDNTLTGANVALGTSVTWTTGQANGAASFPADTGGTIDATAGAGFRTSGAVSKTYEAWLYPTAFYSGGSFLFGTANYDDTNAAGYAFELAADGKPRLVLQGGGVGTRQTVTGTTALDLNQWNHVVIAYNGTAKTATFWVDGAMSGPTAFTLASAYNHPAGSLVRIGADDGPNGADSEHRFIGAMDEVRYWATADHPGAFAALEEGARATSSGVTANYDHALAQAAATGTWKPTYNATANATNNQNSAPGQTRSTFTLSNVIGVSGTLDVDVAGQSTTKYFNRGENMRVAGTLLHADGGFYRRLHADGTTSARSVTAHHFLDTRGGAGSFSTSSATVPSGTGVIPSGFDATVATSATDSYASSTFGQAEAFSWDTYVYDGGSASDATGNALTTSDWFDVDANYYWKENTLYFTDKLMRGDTQRVNATFVNVRGANVPDGTLVDVKWYDNDGVVDTVYTGATTGGNVSDAAFNIPIDWKVGPDDAPGVGKTQYTISAAPGANLGNSMGETSASTTGSTFLIDRVIVVQTVEANPQAGADAYKAYNRGEVIVVTGTLLHADGGPYRVKNPNGTNDRYVRNITVQLWYGSTNASYGTSAFEQTNVPVNENTGAFTATFTVPSGATDSYTNGTSRAPFPTLDYGIRVYDEGGTTSSDAQGNNGHALNELDVDAGVYVSQYWQGRNDTDTNDANFNTGTDGSVTPDEDFTRVYLKNVRGDATTQFNNVKVTRTLRDPNTNAPTATTQTLAAASGFYRHAWGAWPMWTNRVVEYALSSTDTNGNTAVHADPAATTQAGEAHYLVARVETMDTRVLRGQSRVLSVSVADSLDDYADNARFDMSAGVLTDGSVHGDWAEYADASTSPSVAASFASQSSPFQLARMVATSEAVGYRDLLVTLRGGGDARLRGTEWVTSQGSVDHHGRFDAAGASAGSTVWRVTNQSDWERGGARENVDTSTTPGSLAIGPNGATARWVSDVRDLGVAGVPTSMRCIYTTTAAGGVAVWLNASANDFVTQASSVTTTSTRASAGQSSFTVPLTGLTSARYERFTLVLDGTTSVESCTLEYAATSGTALGDGVGAWALDDLQVFDVAVERPAYFLDSDATVDAAVQYAYAVSAGVPSNESYANLRARLFMPNGSLAFVPSQADANELWNATTNETGYAAYRFTLTQTAQAGSPWSVRADTFTTEAASATFGIGVLLGDVQWFAREYGNASRAFVPATVHHRGEEVRVQVDVVNNPGGFQPTGGVVQDDVDDVILTSTVNYDNVANAFYAVWTWPANITANYGTAHKPTVGYTINGQAGFAAPSVGAALYSNFTIPNVWHALSPTDTEEADVFVSGAHLVWVWANQRNARGEPYDVEANYTWLHTNASSGVQVGQNAPLDPAFPATVSKNRGSEPALNGGSSLPHVRTGYASVAATAPAGEWLYRATALDGRGNNATRSETVVVNSPVTPWAFRCTGHAPEYRVGMTVNMSCYFLEKQADGTTAPVEPTKPVYVQWFTKSLNNATLTNLTARQVMNLTNFQSDDAGAQAAFGDRKALAWGNYSIPNDLTLYLNRGIGFRVDTVYNGISIDYHGSLEIAPTEALGKITSTSEKVVGPGKTTAFQVRTSLTHPQLGPIAWGPDSCRTSFQTNATTCVGDQQGTVRMVIKAINASCNCWATYNDPNNPVNDGTSLVNPRLVEMEKDYRYTNGASGFGFTYTYNWTPPGSLSGQKFYVWYAAEFYGQNVTWVEEFVVNTLGGADPLKVTFPATVHLNKPLGFDIHSSFLNATARTGAAASIYVTVRDPTLAVVVSGANPVELGDGQYVYNFTPTVRGQYHVSVTTPSNSGGWESASGTFWAEFDLTQNLTNIDANVTSGNAAGESLRDFVDSFWENANGTWAAWNASFASYEGRVNSTWDEWNASFVLFNASLRQAMLFAEANVTSRLADFEGNATTRLDGWFRWLGGELVPFTNASSSAYGNRTNVTLGFWNFERDAQLYATASLPSFFVAGQSTTVYANLTTQPTGISREATESYAVSVTVNGVTRSASASVTFGPNGATYAVPVVFEAGALPQGENRTANVTLLRAGAPVVWSESTASVFGVSKLAARSFDAGWRFVALPNVVGNVSVEEALAGWDVDVVKWYDANGVPRVWQRGDPLGLNNLALVNRSMGVWAHLVTDKEDVLDTGYLSTQTVALTDGVDNYVAYPGASSVAPTALAAQLGTATYVVSTYEPATGQFLVYDTAPTGIKTLTSLDPGKAYIVRPTGSTLWSVTNS